MINPITDFDIVNFPLLDGDVPRRLSFGVYISQLIRFARVCSHEEDFKDVRGSVNNFVNFLYKTSITKRLS